MEEKPTTAEPVKGKRRWYQFSLRTLLIFTALASCGLGWLGFKIQQARRQQTAIAAIEKLGGRIQYDYDVDSQGNNVANAVLPGAAWLHALLGDDFFRTAYGVDLSDGSGMGWISDDELVHLRTFTELRWLTLVHTQVTDAGLESLEGLTHLECLSLSITKTTDAGLLHLRRLTHLKRLELDVTHVTGSGFGYLEDLVQLEELSLDRTGLTDEGLKHLQHLRHLTELSLNETQVTDLGIAYLKELKGLTRLNLEKTHLTDRGLQHLQGLTDLASLQLGYTQVTDAGVAKLEKALPNCQIEIWPRMNTNAGEGGRD
jgi:hypothetical protein